MPHILLVVLGSMALGLTGFSAQVASAWTMPQAGQAIADIALGVVVGGALAWAYFVWLAPALAMLQRSLGDYVPPDSILPALSDSAIVFFIANVLLAPWVEETLYRGVALPMLSPQLGHWGAVLVGCLCFGLLHWPGGIWYVVLTGVVGGGVFTGLYYTRGGILAPYAAHVVLNGIEFWVAWRLARSV
jgi:membrane protease YdiL (CAAX protease family)